jgi:hypothetical protein
MTIEFQTVDQLHAHYRAVKNRIDSRGYVRSLQSTVARHTPKLYGVSVAPQKAEPVSTGPTPEEYWDKLVVEDLPKSRRAAENMLQYVAQKHGLAYEDIVGPLRKAKIVEARQECYWWLNRKFGFSTITTGMLIGNRDHTCVVQGVPKHEARVQKAEAEAGK